MVKKSKQKFVDPYPKEKIIMFTFKIKKDEQGNWWHSTSEDYEDGSNGQRGYTGPFASAYDAYADLLNSL